MIIPATQLYIGLFASHSIGMCFCFPAKTYVGLSVHWILGVIVAVAIPVVGNYISNASDAAIEKTAEEQIRKRREERKEQWKD